MIPLDIFYKNMQNKSIETLLEAWLTFLASDNPERIIELITKYPGFKPMYETLYQMCRNVEGVMGFFSEELRIMDRNMVKYMIEEQQKEIEENQKVIEEQKKEIKERDAQLEKRDAQLEERDAQLEKRDAQLEERDAQLEERDAQLEENRKKLQEKDAQIESLLKELERYKK